ncbi:MAG: alpha/beta hydrolase [Lactobacillales bacterium]|nr:alpha/beta hydrolase [Lactobacillales bacterium]
MKIKIFSCAAVLVALLVLAGCAKKGTYSYYIGGYDWGAGVSKAIVALDKPVSEVDKKDFKVAGRKVTDAYLSDKNGAPISGASKFATLQLCVNPEVGSALTFSQKTWLNTWIKPYELDITYKNFSINKKATGKATAADSFKRDSFKASDGVEYKYAHSEPAKPSETLVVWLHGIGEGGTVNTDPRVTLLGNKVTSLASRGFQEKLGGANVLVPQCPTYWMDYDGKKTNFNKGAVIAKDYSFYTESLNELINYYKEKTHSKKVILTGCSNGGFMTLVMALKYPSEFVALVPICPALPNKLITDEQVQELAEIPTFFIYSKDDEIVKPELHEIPLIERLRIARASDLRVSTTEHVVDSSSGYKYNGHWSWIYFDNNEAKDDQTGELVWDWMANQIK